MRNEMPAKSTKMKQGHVFNAVKKPETTYLYITTMFRKL